MAACHPLTGTRSTGVVAIRNTTASPIVVSPGSFLFPVISGSVKYEQVYKTARNPADVAAGKWTIAAGATVDMPIFSNIGGARMNVKAGTVFRLEAPWATGFAADPRSMLGTTGGADPLPGDDLALYNFVLYENFGSKPTLEMFKSAIGGRFPAAMIFWTESEPADGLSTSATSRPTHLGAGKFSYTELFEIMIVSTREDSENNRRAQPIRIMDAMSALLVDLFSVDGSALSSPGGLHIRKRNRLGGEDGFYRVFQAYSITLSAQVTMVRVDTRVFDPLLKFRIDAPREDSPTDLPLVVNNLVANPQTP